MSELHTETDLGEGCVPVGWKLCFMIVKQGLSSWKVEVALVAPEFGLEVKRWLREIREILSSMNTINQVSYIISDVDRDLQVILVY